MNRIYRIIFRSFFKKKQNNLIKVLSLGVGLAVGLVLIAKIWFELSYDNFYPDANRIYQIQTEAIIGDEAKPRTWGMVSGGVAPGMKSEIPQVEAATRFSFLIDNTIFRLGDGRNITAGGVILGDSCLFDILPRPVIAGNVKETLSSPMQVMISRTIAEKIGSQGEVIGQTLTSEELPGGLTFVVGGIFEDIPENSHLRYDIIISMPSIMRVFQFDGSMNWDGNDRYFGYVRLMEGTNPEDLKPLIRAMQGNHQDLEAMKEAGFDLTYTLMPLDKLHSGMPETKRMALLLAVLAFAVLSAAVVNYILVVISSLVGRTKEVAIQKCYGAEKSVIMREMFAESLVNLVASLTVSYLLIILFRQTVEELLATSLSALITWQSAILIVLVCVLVFMINGIIPAHIFSKIPVSSAFRGFKETRRKWKLGLLFLQFTVTAFLITFLLIISKQYNNMINENPGYVYKNILYSHVRGLNSTDRQRVIDELRKIPEVEAVSSSDELPIFGSSGNNVWIPGNENNHFNIVDLYYVDEQYLSIMEIPIIDGRGFEKGSSTERNMVVSQSFVNKLNQIAGWNDGVIGKTVTLSEHGDCIITGVYPDIRISSVAYPDRRPSAMFYAETPAQNILIKVHEMKSENVQKINDLTEILAPGKNLSFTPYSLSMVNMYNPARLLRNSVSIGGIVTLIIALIGLIGYVNEEVNRRSVEIAIRKVNGAKVTELQWLFVTDILKISVPALIIGGIGSFLVAHKIMENFADKSGLSPIVFIAAAFLVLLIVLIVININTWRVANKNPVEALKYE